MIVVLVSSVLLAAFGTRGACAELFEHCALNHRLFVSEYILGEFEERLQSKFGLSDSEASLDVEIVRARATLCVPEEVNMPSLLDKDDRPILGTASAAVADCLVTGDRELQSLERFRGIPILAPKDFWEFERNG